MLIKPKNIFAKALSNKLFAQRIVKSKKGKGSYTRKVKNKKLDLSSSKCYT